MNCYHLVLACISVREVFFGFAAHLEFFAKYFIEFNSSCARTLLHAQLAEEGGLSYISDEIML